jgi:quercetin dioxygenase-like cupin family protein
MRRIQLILAVLATVAPISLAAAGGEPMIVAAEKLTWAPAEGLPPGAEVTALYGNPAGEGPFAIRFKFPAGYEIPTHSHPTDELITVLSGTARMAFGEDAGEATAQAFPAGAFMVLPGGTWHHLWVDADTVVELHSTGPFGVELAQH